MSRIRLALTAIVLALTCAPAAAQVTMVPPVSGSSGTITAPATVTGDNVVVTSTDGLTIQNTTPATVGVTAQWSPRAKWCGAAWKSNATAVSETDCLIAEIRPLTGAAATSFTYVWSGSLAGGAYSTLMTLTNAGTLTTTGSQVSGGSMTVAAAGQFNVLTRSVVASSGNGALETTTQATTSGIQDTFGADVTVTACGTGTVTAKSKNTAGEITATGATACTVVFNTSPTFTNRPFCIAVAESGTQPTVTVSTTVSMTVSGLTSGAAFFYHCRGPI